MGGKDYLTNYVVPSIQACVCAYAQAYAFLLLQDYLHHLTVRAFLVDLLDFTDQNS
jgi:hypothetical protein